MRKHILTVCIVMVLLCTAATTVYAMKEDISIVLNAQGGAGGTSEVHLTGGELPVITIPSRTGYDFKGYYTQAMGKGIPYYDNSGLPLQNTSELSEVNYLYAFWTRQIYSITYENMDDATIMDSSLQPEEHIYGVATVIGNPVKDGYSFYGWRVNRSMIAEQGLTLGAYTFSSDIILTAVWNKAALVSVVDTTAAKTVTMSSDDLKAVFNTQVDDPAKGITAEDLNSEEVKLTMTAADADENAEGAVDVISLSQGDVMKFYDFTVVKSVTRQNEMTLEKTTQESHLNELPRTIQVDIALEEGMKNASGYQVYRYHNGRAEALPVGPSVYSNTANENYTVNANGTFLTIYTRKLSTYVVVSNHQTIVPVDSLDMDVQGRVIVSSVGPVYGASIKWGDMKFYYSIDSIWNPEKHAYDERSKFEWIERLSYENGNNQVEIMNHSNADIEVNLQLTDRDPAMDGVDMNVYTTNESSGENAMNMLVGRVPAEGEEAESVSGFLRLQGTPYNYEDLKVAADTSSTGFVSVAKIAVTITHLESPLTPGKN